jgi:hypothetical protein
MKYSAKLSKICQQLQDGGGSATLRSVASDCGEVFYYSGKPNISWGLVPDPSNLNREVARPAPTVSRDTPIGMASTAKSGDRIYVFSGMTEDEATEAVRRAAIPKQKVPKLAAVKAQLASIKLGIDSMEQAGINLGLDVYSVLEDDFDVDSAPCLIADKARRVRAYFDRFPAEERRELAKQMLVEEVQTA